METSTATDLLDRREVASQLRVRYPSAKLFARLERSGALKPIRVTGKLIRYRRIDVERLLTPGNGGGQ